MMKRVMIVAVLLAVMLPFAAQDKASKWTIEAEAWWAQPKGFDTVYAYTYSYAPGNGSYFNFDSKPNAVNNERRWSPALKVAYSNGPWTTWLSYVNYDESSTSTAFAPSTAMFLVNALPISYSPFTGFDSFAYSDWAKADLSTQYTSWDFNIGHNFNPSEKWTMNFYGGLRYMSIDAQLDALYVDNSDWNFWGAGSQDSVRIHSQTHAWGLNSGFISDYKFSKRIGFGAGLEVSMLSARQDNEQREYINSTIYSPYYGPFGVFHVARGESKVIPAVKLYTEAKFNFSDSWYGKVGYRYQTIKDAMSFSYAANDYRRGTGIVPIKKDFSLEGFYFTVGFKF